MVTTQNNITLVSSVFVEVHGKLKTYYRKILCLILYLWFRCNCFYVRKALARKCV